MAGINAPAVKRAINTGLGALAVPAGTLEGVTVAYSYLAKLHEQSRELIFFQPETPASVELSAMKGSARVKRQEEASCVLSIRLTRPGEESTQAGEERAAAIGAVVENYLAADPTVGGVLLKATVGGYTLRGFCDDNGARIDLDYTLNLHSFLT